MKRVGLLCALAIIGGIAGCGGGGGTSGSGDLLVANVDTRDLSSDYIGRAFINELGEIGVQMQDPGAPANAPRPVLVSPDGSTRMYAPPGTSSCWISDFNDAGQFVANGDGLALKWNGDGSLAVLDNADPGAYEYTADALNNSGCAVGTRSSKLDGSYQAQLWASDGTRTQLQAVAGYANSCVYDINDAGWIVGYCANGEFPNQQQVAVVWEPNGTPHTIANGEAAYAINNVQEIAGQITTGACVVWGANGQIRRALQIPTGWPWVGIEDINDLGVVVGTAWLWNGGPTALYAAYRWDATGRAYYLPQLPEHECGGTWSINNAGVAVGWSADSGNDLGTDSHTTLAWTPK